MDTKKINIKNLYIEITDKCNFNCIYCYNDSSSKKSESLSVEAYKNFIEIVKKYNLEDVIISGGEPTLHPQLSEIFEINHNFGLKQNLITNGTGISTDTLPEMIAKNLSFSITIDGHDAASNDLMRGKNSYSITANAIKLLVKNGLSDRVGLRCNLHFGNYKEIYSIVSTLNDMGVTNVEFILLLNMGRATDIEIIDPVKHANILKEIEDNVAKATLDFNINSTFLYKPSMGCPYESLDKELSLRIDSQGNIFPCQTIDDSRFSLGNIYWISSESLKNNILDFSTYTASRQSKMAHCQRCVYKSACEGSCVATSLAYCGDPLGIDGACSIRKAGLKKMILKKARSA